jgi:hypothetical protein
MPNPRLTTKTVAAPGIKTKMRDFVPVRTCFAQPDPEPQNPDLPAATQPVVTRPGATGRES